MTAFHWKGMTNQEIATSVCLANKTAGPSIIIDEVLPMDQGSHFDWGNEIQGHLLSASSYGFVIGNVLGGPICGYFGGKKSMAVTLALTGMSQIASPFASATSYWLLFICQLVSGMCVRSFYEIYSC